jgi:hypothetical protein
MAEISGGLLKGPNSVNDAGGVTAYTGSVGADDLDNNVALRSDGFAADVIRSHEFFATKVE